VIPLHLRLAGQEILEGTLIGLESLPASARNGQHPEVLPPTPAEFLQTFDRIGQLYTEILVILLSAQLSPVYARAREAIRLAGNPAHIQVVDSQTTAAGLGWLVQMAAQMAVQGGSSSEILRLVRGSIPHIYTLFCLRSLTYLYHSGQLDPAQALVGEMLGIAPLFILEEGRLIPVQKTRSPRHLVDAFYEFINEFSSLKALALIQGLPAFTHEARNLHERIQLEFPSVPYVEHSMSISLAALLGPQSLGLVAMENH
jgi:DegV family protein with EDD domain